MPKILNDLLNYLNLGVLGLGGVAIWAFCLKYKDMAKDAAERKIKDDLQNIKLHNDNLSLEHLVDKVNRRRNRK